VTYSNLFDAIGFTRHQPFLNFHFAKLALKHVQHFLQSAPGWRACSYRLLSSTATPTSHNYSQIRLRFEQCIIKHNVQGRQRNGLVPYSYILPATSSLSSSKAALSWWRNMRSTITTSAEHSSL